SIAFSPATAGNFSNVVVFTSNGGNSTNSVTGVGLTPPQLAIVPASLDFGIVDVDACQVGYANFVVTNLGGASITNGTAQFNSPFGVLHGVPFSVPGFGSATVQMYFAPASAGFVSNVVVFTSNGGNSTNTVTGTGASEVAAAFSANPIMGVKPLLVNFTDSS